MSRLLLTLTALLVLFFHVQATDFNGLKQNLVGDKTHVTPQFEVQLSQKVRQAIESGIVITFVVQAKLNQTIDWWFDTTMESKIQTFQVRYFSLTNQYQLSTKKTKLSFVNLEQLLEHLGNKITFVFTANSERGYVMTRFFLDKQALPSIMQLPNVFDADWNLNSDWQTTTLSVKKSDKP